MPTFEFEAMDATGQEVKDAVDAANEEEAQEKIRQMGYFVTKISVKKPAEARATTARPEKSGWSMIGGLVGNAIRQLSSFQDATHQRDEILQRLRDKIAGGRPILISSASNGLVAKLLERAGADCVNTFSGARLRANGMGTMAMLWPILDANAQTLQYTEQDVLPALSGDAFVCACLNFNDPLRNMRVMFHRLLEMGVPSVSNIGPSVSYVDKDSQVYKVLHSAGVTFDNEVKTLKLAKEMGMLTIGVAFDIEDSLQMVTEAQPHLFCYHAGTTKGGLTGYDSGEAIEQTAARSEAAFQQLRAAKPDLLLIAHGAAMETPEEAQYMLQHTSVDGVWTGSSTERLPIERAVTEAANQFATLKLKRGAST